MRGHDFASKCIVLLITDHASVLAGLLFFYGENSDVQLCNVLHSEVRKMDTENSAQIIFGLTVATDFFKAQPMR